MTSRQYTDGVSLTAAADFNDFDTAVYSYLTSLAGQNTLTATGPASMTAYAAGQMFRFTPVSSNNVSTTLNITANSVALGAKNIFWGGAALAGGEIRAGVPALVQYDGTQFNLMNRGFNDNSPSFQAYTSSATSIPTTTFTKILFNVEEWDDNSNFDPATNYRFTPTVPGKYHVDILATLSIANNQKAWLVSLYKNGAPYKQSPLWINGSGSTSEMAATLSAQVAMNGTTDYLEVFGYNTDVAQTIVTTATKNLFSAFRVTA